MPLPHRPLAVPLRAHLAPPRLAPSAAVLAALLAAMALGCGGGDGGDGAPPTGPGDEDYHPPPEDDGSGEVPDGATTTICDVAEDCGYWFCRCDDGAVVNSALCRNGYCADAAAACPDACAAFDHGGWTGEAGGGPGDPEDPSAGSCGALGSADLACDRCFRDRCCAEGEACGDSLACLDAWDCWSACGGDPACQDDCRWFEPEGAALYEELEDCVTGSCGFECGGSL